MLCIILLIVQRNFINHIQNETLFFDIGDYYFTIAERIIVTRSFLYTLFIKDITRMNTMGLHKYYLFMVLSFLMVGTHAHAAEMEHKEKVHLAPLDVEGLDETVGWCPGFARAGLDYAYPENESDEEEYGEYSDFPESEEHCLQELEEQEDVASFFAGIRKAGDCPEYINKQVSVYRDIVEMVAWLERYNKVMAEKRMAELSAIMSSHIKKDLLTVLKQYATSLHAQVHTPELSIHREAVCELLDDPSGLVEMTLKGCNAPELLSVQASFKQYSVALETALKKRARYLERNGKKDGIEKVALTQSFCVDSKQYEQDVRLLRENALLLYVTPQDFSPDRDRFLQEIEIDERISMLPRAQEHAVAWEKSSHIEV